VTLVGAGGVTVAVPPGRSAATGGELATVRAVHVSANYWVLDGDLEDSTQYLTLAATARHPNERVLTAGTGISFVDGGAGGALTVTSTAGVSGTQAAVARSTGGQAISAATNTTVTLSNEESDVGNNFASNTYTVPVTGLYQINLSCTVSAAAVAGVLYLGINGAAVVGTGFGVGYGGFINAATSMVRSLTAGNTVTMIVQTQAACTVGGGQLDVHRIA
jgi:hypothetical protein